MVYYALIFFFAVGYLAIIFENVLHVNKAAVALAMGAICWLIFFAKAPEGFFTVPFDEQVADVAQIILFLLAAMVIVELIDSHRGFKLITDMFYTSSKRKMMWFLMLMSFFMSAVLDNLTAMIVMTSLIKKLVREQKERWLIGSLLVVCVNAGGAWTPIGDVTTTMLWINNKITTWNIIKALFIPSIVCALVAGLLASLFIKGEHSPPSTKIHLPLEPGGKRVFFMGVGSLILIPVWKALFDLPPFMGALLGLGVLWLITDILHFRHGEARWHLRVTHVLTKIDTSGVLFFLGILLAIDALSTAGLLKHFAVWLQKVIPNQNWVAIIIGLISSVIDNVPLVAATMGMYDMAAHPPDSALWQMIAYAAGTGGSILIIGSAAGVAFMGMEKVDFLWYLKHMAWIALVSYFAGIGAYLLIQPFVAKGFS
jgi:NhaD family Na+/H+ antiporter